MNDLDDVQAIEALDSEDVLGAAERFADQCREGWALGRAARELPDADGVENVVILGMGGSGVSGNVVQVVVEPRLPVPLRTIKGYGPLPEWVGRNSLVCAASYSGGTEETLTAFKEAHDRGARAVVVSSGGELAELALAHNVAHVKIPHGLQPRASLGFLTLPILAVLVEVGLVPDLSEDVDELVEVLRELCARCHRKSPAADNPAKQLASSLGGRIPLFYGGQGIGSVAAYRAKCDFNEYGKVPAFAAELPELDHNEVVGFDQLGDVTRSSLAVVMLRAAKDSERIGARFDITERLIAGNVAAVTHVASHGTSALAQVLSLIHLTQFAAIYSGLYYGVDPGPVEILERVKAELKER